MATPASIQDALDAALTFLEEQNKQPYYFAVDFKRRRITIHIRPDDSPVTPSEIASTGAPRIHNKYSTASTLWIGPFKSYAQALSTAYLLSEFHHRQHGEHLLLANGRGISLYPNKPF